VTMGEDHVPKVTQNVTAVNGARSARASAGLVGAAFADLAPAVDGGFPGAPGTLPSAQPGDQVTW
jgi:hypothetical protein